MKHLLKVKIYYEDTDCGGVVYYANYLKYFERARTELLESRGIFLKKLMDEGIFFVVADAYLKYIEPGRYGDIFSVETWIEKIGGASILFRHRVAREEGVILAEGSVKIGCVGRNSRPARLRGDIIESLKDFVQVIPKWTVRQ
ncbi:MAG TPA: YbgC/FadM family acyl-CoA thioesterase [Candidatus Sulfobium mesophilum]|nr:YbgC/FadM family acyl-CoA thioesterase [Candidatus Sulfobium mesophilum]